MIYSSQDTNFHLTRIITGTIFLVLACLATAVETDTISASLFNNPAHSAAPQGTFETVPHDTIVDPYTTTNTVTSKKDDESLIVHAQDVNDVASKTTNEAVDYTTSIARIHIDNYFCTGSLINPHTVLTAAHCIPPRNTDNSGIVVFNADAPRQRGVAIVGTHTHPGEDLALIDLATPVTDRDPIPLAQHAPHIGTPVRAYGWGTALNHTPKNIQRPKDRSPVAELVGRYTVPIEALGINKGDTKNMSDAHEAVLSRPHAHLLHTLMSDKNFNTAITYGDSGGPLIVNNEIIGVASRTNEDTHSSFFNATAQSLDWIYDTAKKH